MKIGEIFDRPLTNTLANQGQARITSVADDAATEELRYELSTFVCNGQYARGLETILANFLTGRSNTSTSQTGAWISGFFGSGKSHLLKVAAHLWANTVFKDGQTARTLVRKLPDAISNYFVELDGEGKRTGGVFAAAGAMPGGAVDAVRLTILGIILRAAGLPENYVQAKFCLWLHDEGVYEKVKSAVESAGRDFFREVANLHVSPHLAKAMMAVLPGYDSQEAVRLALRNQFPRQIGDITTTEFTTAAKQALSLRGKGGQMPCTLLILDEVQQYIGTSYDRSVAFTETAEELQKAFDRRVMVVAAGQSALTDVEMLKKLLDRFRINVALSDSDVESVTRQVLLQKKPTARPEVEDHIDRSAGEISRQLAGTKIAARHEDDAVIVDDYPLLPSRRRFWEECFRQIDAAGTSSQLRSQLRILHDAIAKLAAQPVGRVIPADELFEALSGDMINTGVLLREISDRIFELERTDRLAARLCAVIFLISKLKRGSNSDTGVRANQVHIADLLIDDISVDTGKFRADVAAKLETLVTDGVLMRIDDEYRLQTREGMEWDRDFRERIARMGADTPTLQVERDELIYGTLAGHLDGKFLQGKSRVPRKYEISRESEAPPSAGPDIPIWLRDGWSSSEKDMLGHLRKVGVNDATIGVFVPQRQAEELKRWIVEAKAAKDTVDTRGVPTTKAGEEARQGIITRQNIAERERKALAEQVVGNAKVFLGGGSEQMADSLKERLEKAREESLMRLFPRFPEADAAAWPQVLTRVKAGAHDPFEPVGYKGDLNKQPVCREVLTSIGAGKSGGDIRRDLGKHPYGWPQDSIDAALMALHRDGQLKATLNGVAIAADSLDQNKISKAEFRPENATLTAVDRINLRSLYSKLEVKCKSGEEVQKASEFLRAAIDLSRTAGGDPPVPGKPRIKEIEDLGALTGNEQALGITKRKAKFESEIEAWKEQRDLIAARMPNWQLLVGLARHAPTVEGVAEIVKEIDAVREQRLLLVPLDPVPERLTALGGALRKGLGDLFISRAGAYRGAHAELAANPMWMRLDATDASAIISANGLHAPSDPPVANDKDLLSALDANPPSNVKLEIAAVPGKVQTALADAARRLEPKVRVVRVDKITLRTVGEVDAWLGAQREKLVDVVSGGNPALVE